MVFQDFDNISERRNAERQQKFRRRVTIAAVTAFVLIIIIAAGVFAYVSQNNDERSPESSPRPPRDISRAQKMITTICGSTLYKTTCHDALSAAAKKDPSINEPSKFFKASIRATSKEIERAIEEAESYKYNTPETKAAFKICKRVLDDAEDDLEQSVSIIGRNKHDLGKLVEKAGELNNWLSAVLSYQQTCIDAFPEGDIKSEMGKNLNLTKQFTSNSLAMINQFSSVMSSVEDPNPQGKNRRLLESKGDDEKNEMKPNLTVKKDGSGNFKTISEALKAVPKGYKGRFVIYVAAGVYEERVVVPKDLPNLTIIGEGSQKSIITGSKSVGDGVSLYDTATFVGRGEGLFVKSMGIRNEAGPSKGEAVAARIQSDRATFESCRFEGYQNTLFAQTHRQFYRNCIITGTVDFIFGDAAAVFQDCQMKVRKPLEGQENTVTAQSRIDKFETTGFVLQKCQIGADESLEPVKKSIRTYLGRPAKKYSRTIVMESTLEDLIHPDGWLALKGDYGLKTLYYAEYKNKGPGAGTDGRVKWPGYQAKIGQEEAIKYTVGPFLQGNSWIKNTGAPVHFGLL